MRELRGKDNSDIGIFIVRQLCLSPASGLVLVRDRWLRISLALPSYAVKVTEQEKVIHVPWEREILLTMTDFF
jgi:hypothetical protein